MPRRALLRLLLVSGRDAIKNAQTAQGGFLKKEDMEAIAADPETRLTLLLVRCGGGRFLAPANQVQHFIDIIERDALVQAYLAEKGPSGPQAGTCSDYVRDVSLRVNVKVDGGRI